MCPTGETSVYDWEREGDFTKDEKKTFKESIPLNQEMSVDEAIGVLRAFYGASTEGILDAFINLKNFNGKILFAESHLSNQNPCIVIRGIDSGGYPKWHNYIDEHMGRLYQHTS